MVLYTIFIFTFTSYYFYIYILLFLHLHLIIFTIYKFYLAGELLDMSCYFDISERLYSDNIDAIDTLGFTDAAGVESAIILFSRQVFTSCIIFS